MDKPTTNPQIAQLASLLIEQVAAHKKLLAMLKRKRHMLSTADHKQLTNLSIQENEVVQSISELEKQRLQLIGQLTLTIEPKATAPMRLGDLAHRLPEPDRGHLLVLRQQLKQEMEQIKNETVVAKRATESLVRHMQGLIHTVGSALAGVGVYSRQGCLPKEAMTVRTFHATA